MRLYKKVYYAVLGFILSFQLATMAMEQSHPTSTAHSQQIALIDIDVGQVTLSDPPFYLIETEDGKSIYILGSIHPLPITKALSLSAYQEFDRIAKSRPIYITEHSTDNEVNLSNLNEAATHESWRGKIEHANGLMFDSIKDELVNIDMERKSNVRVEELENIDPWLTLPIFMIHIGVELKRQFSSFEHSISQIWGSSLHPEHYLEEHGETLSILKASSVLQYNHNIGGINYFLNLLATTRNYATDTASQSFWKSQFIKHIQNFTWMNLNSTLRHGPTIERNRMWIKTLLKNFYHKGNTFLIVVGLAHLEGPDNFLSLLLHNVQIKGKIKRFSNEEGWKDLL